MPFSRAQLLSYENQEVPDLIEPGVRLLFVGINPSLWTAAVQAHFARPGNRFYPALHAAGITDSELKVDTGMTAKQRDYLLGRGVGITNVVSRATARADELSAEELKAGAERLRRTVREFTPRVVAFAGITAYRLAFGRPKAKPGRQEETIEGAELWVVPNPSGLNAHESVASLGEAYRSAAQAAGIVP